MTYLKIALIGDGAVGKTSLRERYIGGTFQPTYMMTIGADFASYKSVVSGKQLTSQIWDLAGQPRFESVRSLYYRGTMGVLLVFDVSRSETLQNVPTWIDECFKNTGVGAIPVVLLANKIDLRDVDPLALTHEQGKKVAEEVSKQTLQKGYECQYLETSAKTGENVEEAFNKLAEIIIEMYK
ncbi:MAG: Rab family GTPase [Candidatus Hodarchaeales archaeon]|jgi:small GTP-binding protein